MRVGWRIPHPAAVQKVSPETSPGLPGSVINSRCRGPLACAVVVAEPAAAALEAQQSEKPSRIVDDGEAADSPTLHPAVDRCEAGGRPDDASGQPSPAAPRPGCPNRPRRCPYRCAGRGDGVDGASSAEDAQRAAEQGDLADLVRALDAIGHDPAPDKYRTLKIWSGVLGSLTGLGIILGATLGKLLPGQTEVGAATDLDVAFAPGSPTGTDVTVTWKAPTTEPKPDRYDVALTPVPAATARQKSADGTMTSIVFDGVVDGTYDVTVLSFAGTNAGEATTRRVTVAAPSIPAPPTGTPDPPTDVTITAGLSLTSGLRGLTVAWTPPAVAPQGYTVLVQTDLKPPVVTSPVAVGPMTSWRIEPFPPGTYGATVIATNGDQSSTPARSPFVKLAATPGTVPGTPRNLTTRVFASRSAADKAAVTIMWDPPDSGGEVLGYDVGLGLTDVIRRVGNALFTTYDPAADGTLKLGLVAYNAAGPGTGILTTVTVDHTALDPAGLDWTPVFGADQVAEWKKLKDPIAGMDETAIWARVLRVMEDEEGKHGGLASYESMLFAARLLALWIDALPTPPTEEQIVTTADTIAATCKPQKFPTTKPAQPYADRMAPWRAASTVVSPMTKKSIPLRYKLFGLVRTLERYLGERT